MRDHERSQPRHGGRNQFCHRRGAAIDVIANLDFSKAVDSSVSLCPKCGAEMPEGAGECPQCGVDPATGQLSEAAKKRATR